MTKAERLYLTRDQAIDAIARDFKQYPSQFNLLASLMKMVLGGDAYLLKGGKDAKLWIKTPDRKKPFQIDEERVGALLVHKLQTAPPPIEHLANVCSRVFQTPVMPAWDTDDPSSSGVWVETGMVAFVCRQCGHCCQTLDYQDGCSVTDYHRWQKLGRHDILAWVGTVKHKGQIRSCRIWMIPGSNRYADRCPWLKSSPENSRYVCTIHDVRPTICREYPGSRKHARMTGCRGI